MGYIFRIVFVYVLRLMVLSGAFLYVPTCFYRSDDARTCTFGVRKLLQFYCEPKRHPARNWYDSDPIPKEQRQSTNQRCIVFWRWLLLSVFGGGRVQSQGNLYAHSTGSPSYGCCDYSSGSDTTTDVQRLVDEVRSCRAGRPGLLAGSRDGPVRSDEYGCGCYRRFVEAFPDCQQQRCSGSTCSGTGPEPNSQ